MNVAYMFAFDIEQKSGGIEINTYRGDEPTISGRSKSEKYNGRPRVNM